MVVTVDDEVDVDPLDEAAVELAEVCTVAVDVSDTDGLVVGVGFGVIAGDVTSEQVAK